MKLKIEVDPNISRQLFDVIEFLDKNKDQILLDLKKETIPYIEMSDYMKGPLRIAYDQNFENFIRQKIKDIIDKHFNFNAEQLNILTDIELLKVLGLYDLFFHRNFYD